jgi:CSLREA domain-containing protein
LASRTPRPARYRPRIEVLEGRCLPSTLTVTTAADETNPNDGVLSLREAIAAASSGDTIKFASSLSGQTITLTSGQLDITKSLTIKGPGPGKLAISGDNLSRVFEIDGAATNVTLSGLTITGGFENSGFFYGGAGILNFGTLTVSNCTISGNTDTFIGGGIENIGTLTLSKCTLTANSANSDGSTAMTGFLGGGLYNVGNATVQDTTVSGNLAAGDGGGIYNNFGATLTLSGSTVTGNQYADVFNLGNLVQKDSTVGYLIW